MPSASDQIAHMITGYWVSQAVHVAAKLQLADHLAHGPRTAEELAQATGTHARSLYRLLRMLASVGVFSEFEPGRFQLNEMAESLRRDAPGSQWAMAVMMGDEHYAAWGGLFDTIRTGETAFDRLYGRPIFDYLQDHPDAAQIFDAAMTAIHGRETQTTLDAYDFSGIGVLADVGGGNGSNLIGILGHVPSLRGVLFDLPHVIDRARPAVEKAGLTDRCELVTGDFFEAVPVQADAYFLRHIIHDWDDDRAGAILRNIRQSCLEGARLLVVEYVLPPGDTPSFGKLMDLNMMLLPGGVERTEQEFRDLFTAAGFRLTRIIPTAGDLCIVEGEPA